MRKNDLSYGVVRHCAVVLAALVVVGAVGAVDPVAYVREALARGGKTVTVPKGRYVIDTDDTVFFRLKGLDGVTVDFGGSELVCKKRTRYIGLEHCTNTVVRNVTLDMDPLPFSQGVIEKVGPDGAWEVRVLDDYAQPEERAGSGQAYRNVWPLQVYDRTTFETKNWMRAFNGFKMEAIGPCRFRVTGGGNRRGDVGDYCVWRTGETTRQAQVFGIHLEKCRDCRVEDVTMYACWGVAFNEHFTSGSVWKNCRLMRRPPETDARPHSVPRLRSGAHDAFNSRMAGKGPRLENCSFAYHCDDCVNISGYYAVVTEVEGTRRRRRPSSPG